MVKGYCKICKAEKEGIGATGRNCPTCKALLAAEKPKERTIADDFSQGIPGLGGIQPEEMVKMKELMQKGIIKDPREVFKVGLTNLSSTFMPGQQQAQQSGSGFESMVSAWKEVAKQKMESQMMLNMQDMISGKGEHPADNGSGFNMKNIMEMMSLQLLVSSMGGQKNDSRPYEMQIESLKNQMAQERQQQQFQTMMLAFQSKSGNEGTFWERMMQMQQMNTQQNQAHYDKIDQLRQENSNTQMAMLREQMSSMAQHKGWDEKLSGYMNDEMSKIFLDRLKAGGSAEKSGIDTVTEFISSAAPTINALLQTYLANKQNQQQPNYMPPQMPPVQPQPPQAQTVQTLQPTIQAPAEPIVVTPVEPPLKVEDYNSSPAEFEISKNSPVNSEVLSGSKRDYFV